MQKMTLLEMVQNIASALETDEISSISDTTESLQIAEVIKETFYEQFNNIVIPEFRGLITLDDVNDLTRPNYLKVPANVSKIDWIRYKDFRNSDKFTEVTYIDPEDFIDTQLQYSSTSNNVFLTQDPSGVSYYVTNNGRPQFYTMFDDEYLVFNRFDADSEDTLQSSNTIVFGSKVEEFELEDDYIPPIDGNLFPLLLAEAKSTCFINLKQISSSKEEQRARRQRIRMQNDQFKDRKAQRSYFERGPNFARNR
jgi:hypothetical protein